MSTLQQPTPLQEDRNWKNVGNWHWVSKDVIVWAKAYFDREVQQLSIDHNGIHVTFSNVIECDGDCSLNVRKGKLISIYDIKLVASWTAVDKNNNASASGKVTVPEIAHNTEADEYVFDVSMDDDSRSNAHLKEAVRKGIPVPMKQIFARFAKELMENNSKDIYIDGAVPSALLPTADLEDRKRLAKEMAIQGKSFPDTTNSVTSSSTGSSTTTKAVLSNNVTNGNSSLKQSTKTNGAATSSTTVTTVRQSTEFVAGAQDVFDAFVHPKRVGQWTQGQCQLDSVVGGHFMLYNGAVTGEYVTLDPGKKIVQKWRFRDWPQDITSTVTLTFTQTSSGTVVDLLQTGVPSTESDKTAHNWRNMIFNRIKATFGYLTHLFTFELVCGR